MHWPRVIQGRASLRRRADGGRDGLSELRAAVRVGRGAVALVLLALWPAVAGAQTVINPRIVEFTASADHAATVGGGPAVVSYELRWYASGATAPLSTADLGKPTPDAQNKITVNVATLVMGLPIGAGYRARVAAIGPAGEGVSDPSNFFDVASPPRPATAVSLRR